MTEVKKSVEVLWRFDMHQRPDRSFDCHAYAYSEDPPLEFGSVVIEDAATETGKPKPGFDTKMHAALEKFIADLRESNQSFQELGQA